MRARGWIATAFALSVALAAWLVTRPSEESALDDGDAMKQDSPARQVAALDAAPRPRVPTAGTEAADLSSRQPFKAAPEDSVLVRGRVIDEDGAGVSDVDVVAVVLLEADWGPVDFAGQSVHTDADGSFEVKAPRLSNFVRAFEAEATSASAAVPIVANSAPVTLRVARRRALAGVVLDPAGAPVPQTLVLVHYREAGGRTVGSTDTTDHDGRFALRLPPDVMAADLVCGALENIDTPRDAPLGVEVTGVRVPSTDLTLRFVAPSPIRGKIVSATNEPVGAISLTAIRVQDGDPSRRPRVSTHSAADGRFAFDRLRPGRWTIVATVRNASFTYTTLEVEAPADEVTLRLEPASALVGRVVGADVAGFEVWWSLPEGPEGGRMGTTNVDAAGAFRIDGLPRTAPVRLFARRIGDGRFASADLVFASAQEQTLTLSEGHSIVGQSDGYSGRVIAHQGDLQHEGRASGGKFEIHGLPPGRWTLRKVASNESMQWETGPSTLADADETDVRLR